MEFWYLNDKKFKIAVLKEFSEQPENSESHYNGLRIEINKQEYFIKEIDILKKETKRNSVAKKLKVRWSMHYSACGEEQII